MLCYVMKVDSCFKVCGSKNIRIPVNVAFKIQLFTLVLVLKSDIFYGQQTTVSISLGLTKQ